LSGSDAVATEATTLTENAKGYWGFGQQAGSGLQPGLRSEQFDVVNAVASTSTDIAR